MSENTHALGLDRVTNDAVWRHTKVLFLAATLLFLVNITIGFDNALASETIPRWQVLTHLHAGALGWITLSVIGLAIWFFTGKRKHQPGARNLFLDLKSPRTRVSGRSSWASACCWVWAV